MGFVCTILSVAVSSCDRVCGMGQARESMGSVKLQAAHKPYRAHGVRQLILIPVLVFVTPVRLIQWYNGVGLIHYFLFLLPFSRYLNTVTVSPDGSLCASGGKDGTAMLWDLKEGKRLYSLDAGDIIHSLVFSPNRYWLCAATTAGIKVS